MAESGETIQYLRPMYWFLMCKLKYLNRIKIHLVTEFIDFHYLLFPKLFMGIYKVKQILNHIENN